MMTPIDRNCTQPDEFIGKGWNFWLGPMEGDGLEGQPEQDDRSVALIKLDLSKVQLVTVLRGDETSVPAEENLVRLKSLNYICLDIDICRMLWKNKHLIPESWTEKVGGNACRIFFEGKVLRYKNGNRFVPHLCLRDGVWNFYLSSLGINRDANMMSAVLVG